MLNIYEPINTDAVDIDIVNRPGGADVLPEETAPNISFTLANKLYSVAEDIGRVDNSADVFVDDATANAVHTVSLHGDFSEDDADARNARIARIIIDSFNKNNVDPGWVASPGDDSDTVILTAERSGYQFIEIGITGGTQITSADFIDSEVQVGRFNYTYDTEGPADLAPIWPSFSATNPEDMDNPYEGIIRDGVEDSDNLTDSEVVTFIKNLAIMADGWVDTDFNESQPYQDTIKTSDIDPDSQDMLAERQIGDGENTRWMVGHPRLGNIRNPAVSQPDLFSQTNILQNGTWPTYTIPTYIGMIVSTGENQYEWVLYQVGDLNSSVEQTAEEVLAGLFSRLRVANPRLSLVLVSDTLRIQPANYNEAANFVLEVYVNSTLEGAMAIQRIETDVQNDSDVMLSDLSDNILVPVSANPFNDPLYYPPGQDTLAIAMVPDGTNTQVATLAVDSLAISREFDVDRPWPFDEVNPNLEYPIFSANEIIAAEIDGETTTRTSNKVIAADIGWTKPLFSADTDSEDLPQSYTSYFERSQFPISPEFTTESLHAIALWVDGSTSVEFLQPEEYNKLQIRLLTTDNPGHTIDLTSSTALTNTFPVSEEYKVDFRLNGRFFNMRVTDNLDSESFGDTEINGKQFNRNTLWRVSGAQLEIMPSGRR